MSQDPTVTAGPENRSATPTSLNAPASPAEADAKLQFFAYDKETLIVSANQQMLLQDHPRRPSGQHPLKPQGRQMSHPLTSEAMSSNQEHTEGDARGVGQSDLCSNTEISPKHEQEKDDYGQHKQKRGPQQKSLAETTSNAEKSHCDLQSPGISTVNAATSQQDIQSNRLFSPKHQQIFRENRESANTAGIQSPVFMMSNE